MSRVGDRNGSFVDGEQARPSCSLPARIPSLVPDHRLERRDGVIGGLVPGRDEAAERVLDDLERILAAKALAMRDRYQPTAFGSDQGGESFEYVGHGRIRVPLIRRSPRRPILRGDFEFRTDTAPVRTRQLATQPGMHNSAKSMPEPQVIHVDESNFDEVVLHSNEPFLLDFSATWCPPCRQIEPILERLAAEHAGSFRVGKLDIEASPAIAVRYGVRGAPTLVVFERGVEVRRRLGAASKSTLLGLMG